jgi:Ca2+-transporting ATPase
MVLHKDPSQLSKEEVISSLNVDPLKGLSSQEVLIRLEIYGQNKLKDKKNHPVKDFLFSQIKDPIIWILIAALSIKVFTKGITDAIAIGSVIIFNACLGLFQTLKTNKTLESLKSLLTHSTRVLRDSVKQDILSDGLVPGDIIYLESGMRVPADARLLETLNFYVDESMLTGESVPVLKEADLNLKQTTVSGDKLNMVFLGTTIVKGRAKACITSIGEKTELGKLAKTIYSIEPTASPLAVRLAIFSKRLSLFLIILILVMVGIGLLLGYNALDLFLLAVSLAVAAVPEGLPLAINLCLVIGVKKMAENKALVKHMDAVETLGSTSVVCTDKTGTLTCNQMTVTEFFIGNKHYLVTGSGYSPEGQVNGSGDFSHLKLIASLAHETSLLLENNHWICNGDPTEAALIVLGKKLGFVKSNQSTEVAIPFESEEKFMATLLTIEEKKTLLIKGSLDKILSFCTKMYDHEGNIIPLNKNLIEQHQEALSLNALRAIACAILPSVYGTKNTDIKEAIFVALIGIQDPLRPHMTEIMQSCSEAGISVKMITGDHPHTAQAIYKKLFQGSNYTVLIGHDIDKMSAHEKSSKLPKTDVFARVSPQNKLEIVNALKEQGQIVAMTGDGVNDAPCLKGAHIGIAMGSGADVAKEAASLILLDDNFNTLVKAIKMGRMIYKTLQNLITYLLTTAASGVLSVVFAILLRWPLPLAPIQFLWINLVTDGSSTLPMCFEAIPPHIMQEKPIKPNEALISKHKLYYMIIISSFMSCGTLGMFYYSFFIEKKPLIYAQTLAFITLGFFQIWNVQNSRSLKEPLLISFKHLKRIPFRNNIYLLLTMLVALILQVCSVIIPFLQPYLKTTYLTNRDWITSGILTFSVIIVSDLYKYINYLKNNKNQ